MMIHLPLLANRLAQFAARFEQLPDGNWAWFRNDWSEGLLVSADEHARLIERNQAMLVQIDAVLRRWVWVALALIVLAVVLSRGQIANWWGGLIAVLPLPWAFVQAWRADRLPVAVTDGRMAVLPARGLVGGGTRRLQALPPSVAWMMIGLGGLLLFRLWQEHSLASDWKGTVLGVAVALFGLTIVALRARR